MTCKPSLLDRLPLELWWYTILLLPPADLCVVRRVSRTLRILCSDPRVWKHLELKSRTQWRLKQIMPIVAQHSIPHIRSISVHNVRDDVVHYLLNACPYLEELVVSGWTTLSHHALKCNSSTHGLRRLCLHGQDDGDDSYNNAPAAAFAAIDSFAITRLIRCCPRLQILEVFAQAHVHLPTLLDTFARQPPQALRRLVLPTYHTISAAVLHAECLLNLCPKLESVLLIPSTAPPMQAISLSNVVAAVRAKYGSARCCHWKKSIQHNSMMLGSPVIFLLAVIKKGESCLHSRPVRIRTHVMIDVSSLSVFLARVGRKTNRAGLAYKGTFFFCGQIANNRYPIRTT